MTSHFGQDYIPKMCDKTLIWNRLLETIHIPQSPTEECHHSSSKKLTNLTLPEMKRKFTYLSLNLKVLRTFCLLLKSLP